MQLTTTGDLQSLSFLTNPTNWLDLRRFLRATGLGHSTNICYDRQPAVSLHDDTSDSDSPDPNFGVFEP
jgi:hypothetical protein